MTDQPAFPGPSLLIDGAAVPQHGLTKREWYAGMALAGFAASPSALGKWNDGTVARCAFEVAAAMIAASKDTDRG